MQWRQPWLEKVISNHIKYVDEMDAQPRAELYLRELPLNGVLSTCFGHDQQPQTSGHTVVELSISKRRKNSLHSIFISPSHRPKIVIDCDQLRSKHFDLVSQC